MKQMVLKLPVGLYSILICFSSIYLATLPLGFPHVVFVIVFFCFIYSSFCKRVQLSSFISIFFLCLFGMIFYLKGGSLKAIINHLSSLLMFPLVIELLRKKNYDYLVGVSVSFIKVTCFFLVAECLFRFVFSTLWPLDGGIYRFKYYSFMFKDTNFTGMMILAFYFYIKYLKIYHSINLRKYEILLGILCVLTFSRAAIAALFLCEFLFYKLRKIDNINLFIFKRVIPFIVITALLYIYVFEVLFSSDGSFRSKFNIMNEVMFFIDNNSFNLNWGVGLDHSKKTLGVYAHNYFLLYFFEIGVVGLFLKIFWALYVLLKTKMKGVLILLPYLIAAQSAAGYGIHYIYTILAIIVLLNKSIKTE